MKSVMLSIQPKWCDLIANGKKTLEVRKTRPSCDVPFKCYIYCTKPTYPHEDFITVDAGTDKSFAFYGGGKVIGEFICDRYDLFSDMDSVGVGYRNNGHFRYVDPLSQLSRIDLMLYRKGKNIYGWHISNLKIYDKPKELSDFKKYNRTCYYDHLGLATPKCKDCKECNFTRPPQSWCYVENI